MLEKSSLSATSGTKLRLVLSNVHIERETKFGPGKMTLFLLEHARSSNINKNAGSGWSPVVHAHSMSTVLQAFNNAKLYILLYKQLTLLESILLLIKASKARHLQCRPCCRVNDRYVAYTLALQKIKQLCKRTESKDTLIQQKG
jgi:hypothetical protein